MRETTFLVLRQEHYMLNYAFHTKGRTLCVKLRSHTTRRTLYIKLCLSYHGKNITCETTSLVLREEHYVLNYVPHTKRRTLCVKLRHSYYGKNIMCETTSLILREEH